MVNSPDKTENGRVALELAPGVRQEQILAPQLRESLRVLQMDWATLVNEVRHEAEVNPVVEVESPGDMPPVSEQLRAETREETLADSAAPVEDESNPSVNVDEDAVERRQRFFDRQVAVESLQEHLLAQVGTSGIPEEERELAELLIGDINDDGRYIGSFDELATVMGVSRGRLSGILARIQSFDPPGVGARNLRECLSIQARQLDVRPEIRELTLRIVAHHLTAVAQLEVPALAEALGVSEEDCRAAVSALRTLEPKPGRPYLAHGRHPQFIRPELDAEQTQGYVTLTSCERDLPKLKISPLYRQMAADVSTPSGTRRYLKERIGSAEVLQEAIRRRGETILRVAEVVFNVQYDFFRNGFESLQPLTIEEVARRTGLHGTTVGRAVRGKYVRTPRGVFELSRFFCVGRLAKPGASAVSATAVKCRLMDLLRDEADGVRTDEELAAALSRDGVRISRRTIAKYRSELGIPSAVQRQRRRRLA